MGRQKKRWSDQFKSICLGPEQTVFGLILKEDDDDDDDNFFYKGEYGKLTFEAGGVRTPTICGT